MIGISILGLLHNINEIISILIFIAFILGGIFGIISVYGILKKKKWSIILTILFASIGFVAAFFIPPTSYFTLIFLLLMILVLHNLRYTKKYME